MFQIRFLVQPNDDSGLVGQVFGFHPIRLYITVPGLDDGFLTSGGGGVIGGGLFVVEVGLHQSGEEKQNNHH